MLKTSVTTNTRFWRAVLFCVSWTKHRLHIGAQPKCKLHECSSFRGNSVLWPLHPEPSASHVREHIPGYSVCIPPPASMRTELPTLQNNISVYIDKTFILITKRRKYGWFQVNVYENHRVYSTETRGFDSPTGVTPKVQATLLVDPSWILGSIRVPYQSKFFYFHAVFNKNMANKNAFQ